VNQVRQRVGTELRPENLAQVTSKTVSRRDVGSMDELGVRMGKRSELGAGAMLIGGVEQQQNADGAGNDKEEEGRCDAEPDLGLRHGCGLYTHLLRLKKVIQNHRDTTDGLCFVTRLLQSFVVLVCSMLYSSDYEIYSV
jgi:hypothetical protein